jgi:hypothetical protein
MEILKKPRQDGMYRDRDIDCQEALEKDFAAIADRHPTIVVDAAGGTMAPILTELAKRAERAGWSLEEIEVAISELAQNLLDDEAQE